MPLTQTEELRQWLAGRPWLNLEKTGAEVQKQLSILRRLPLKPAHRAGLLELYHPYLVELTEALEKNLLDAALPLSPQARASSRLLLGLSLLMVSNLSQAVFPPDFKPEGKARTSSRHDLLLRTTDWLARLGLHQAQIYRPPGARFWKILYRLYALTAPGGEMENDAQIQAQLARILIFNLATPHRYRPRELKQIDLLLRDFSHLVQFHPRSTTGKYKAVFFFDLNTPAPPAPIKLLGQISSPETSPVFVFPQRLSRKLLQYATTPGIRGNTILPAPQAKKLAVQLARLLSAPKRRRWRRLAEDRNCQLVVGLGRIVDTLAVQGKMAEGLFEMLRTERKLREIDGLFDGHFELVPLEEETMAHFAGKHLSETSVHWMLAGDRPQVPTTDIWSEDGPIREKTQTREKYPGQLANSSAQGYCLLWIDHTPNILRIGEPVGILHTQGEIEIGTVRWMKQDPEPALSVGLELLSFAVTGVVVYPHMGEIPRANQTCELGLLLPPQPALKKPASLLVSPGGWKTGQWVRVYRDKAYYEVYSLKQRIDATPAYDLFSLEKIS